MNSLHINYWTHLNLDLTFGHLNTLPWPNTFSQTEVCQGFIHIHFNNTSDDGKFSEKNGNQNYVDKPYHAAKEFE